MYHFIVNPTAASGKGAKIWRQVEDILKKENVAYEAHILQSADEATLLAAKLTKQETDKGMAAEDVGEKRPKCQSGEERQDCHIVVLGGDGTLNAVLQGFRDFSAATLSCIPMGSGNDFARGMGLSKNVGISLHNIFEQSCEKCLDYGELTYEQNGKRITRRFLISSGMGYDADICEEAGKSRLKECLNRIHLGKLVYVLVGIKQIFTRQSVPAKITMFRGKKRKVISVDSLFFAVGMIHAYEGGGVPFCPQADAGDGLIDVCLVRNMPKWKLLLAVALVYIKQHYRFRAITPHRCERIVIETEKPQWFHMDGDTPGQIKRLELQCKKGLRFLY